MAAKMIDKLEISCMSFCASYIVIRKSRGGKFGLGNGCSRGTKQELIMEF